MRVLAVCLCLVGCSGSGDDGAATDPVDPCADASDLSWQSFGEAFTGKWCTGCHTVYATEPMRSGAPLGVDFDTLEGLQAYWDEVWPLVASDHPPSASISDAELEALERYLRCSDERP